MNARIARAVDRARACAITPLAELLAARPVTGQGAGGEPPGPAHRRLAIGDPQAPLERFFAILDHNHALSDDGWLRPEVYLLSMGDHFDWGGSAERAQAAVDGLALLAWLAAHPAERVGLILGNHDLGRLGELCDFDDASFGPAHELAARAYRGGDVDTAAEAELLERYPRVPTAELLARDFAAFLSPQRDLVNALLQAGRLRVAIAVAPRTLACHAGVTRDELAVLGMDTADSDGSFPDAIAIADALQRALRAALAARGETPLEIPGLHRPGDSEFGEGGGMFYHRPTNPESETAPSLLAGPYRRRYDARRLPRGLTQIVGHIADGKCRKLFGTWASATPTPLGALRHLRTDGVRVSYRPGLPDARARATGDAIVIFTDGRMAHTPADRYQLLDLARVTG